MRWLWCVLVFGLGVDVASGAVVAFRYRNNGGASVNAWIEWWMGTYWVSGVNPTLRTVGASSLSDVQYYGNGNSSEIRVVWSYGGTNYYGERLTCSSVQANPTILDVYSGPGAVPEYISKGCVTNWSPNPKKFILSYSDGTAEESPILFSNQPVNWWCSQGKTNSSAFTTTINEIVYNSDLGTNWNNIYGPYWAGTNTVTTGGTGYTGGAPGTGGMGTGSGSTNPVTGDQIATVNTNQTAVMYQGFQSILGGLRTLGQQLGTNSAPDYSGVLGSIKTNTQSTADQLGGLGVMNTNLFGGTNGAWNTNGFFGAAGGGTNAWGRGTNLGGWGLSAPTIGSNVPVFTVPLSALVIDGASALEDVTLDFGESKYAAVIPLVRGFLLVVVAFGFVMMSVRIVGKVGGV